VGLTEFEEDYLNATINSNQKELTSDEKREFVKKHKDVMSIPSLMVALNLTKGQVEDIKISTDVPDEIVELFRQEDKGYGRGIIDIQAISQVAKKVKDPEAMKYIGEWQQNTEKTDRVKRKARREIATTVANWTENKILTDKYTVKEIVEKAITKVENAQFTGDVLPKGSEKKFDVFASIIRQKKYDFAVVLMSEGLTRKTEDEDFDIDSESKIIVDSDIKDITLVGLELDKIEEVATYGKTMGKEVKTVCSDVLDYIQNLIPDNRVGIIYLNGDTLWAQRPQIINLLNTLYPKSIISFVYIDYFFGKSQIKDEDKKKELATVYALRFTHATLIDLQFKFNKQIDYTKNIEWNQYAYVPQNRFIVKIIP
jgi:hypothetical protein